MILCKSVKIPSGYTLKNFFVKKKPDRTSILLHKLFTTQILDIGILKILSIKLRNSDT